MLVAAGITDPRNLGALLRSAECAGVTGVVLPQHRSARLSPTVAKTAAGALEHLPFAAVGGIPTALATMRELGVWSIGLAGEAKQSLYALPLGEGPVALVVGSEEKGLPPLVRRRCDAVAAIPQHGALPSLNVGVAGAVACFEVARQRAGAAAAAELRGRRHLGRAEGTAVRCHRNLAQALWALAASRARALPWARGSSASSSALSGSTTAKKTTVATMRKDRSALMNDAVVELRVVHREVQVAEVLLAEDGADERGDEVLHERGDHGGEGGADDDGYRQVDDVAPQDELLEVTQHRCAPFVLFMSA